MAPRGRFALAGAGKRPVVLISGGVGITPMMAMAEQIVGEGKRTAASGRSISSTARRTGGTRRFALGSVNWPANILAFKLHVSYSAAGSDDVLGISHDSAGYIDINLIKQIFSFGDYDFYLCGPAGFMRSLTIRLTGMGVPVERIFYESFGPATVLKPEARLDAPIRPMP